MEMHAWEQNYSQQLADMLLYTRLLYEQGFAAACGGNVSIRCGESFLITAGGQPLRCVTADDLVLCGLDGVMLEGAPGRRPSKEVFLHSNVYKARPEVNAVIHAHPNHCTAFSIEGKPLPLLTESAKLKLQTVPNIPAASPGSQDLADSVYSAVALQWPQASAFLMQAHGILAMADSLQDCFHTVELMEDTCRVALIHHQLLG